MPLVLQKEKVSSWLLDDIAALEILRHTPPTLARTPA